MNSIQEPHLAFLGIGESEDEKRKKVLDVLLNDHNNPTTLEQAQKSLADLKAMVADLGSRSHTDVQERYLAAGRIVIPLVQDKIYKFEIAARDAAAEAPPTALPTAAAPRTASASGASKPTAMGGLDTVQWTLIGVMFALFVGGGIYVVKQRQAALA